MSQFRLFLIGSPQTPVIDVDVADIDELHSVMTRSRFVRGQLVAEESEGLACAALIATSRIQMLVEM